MRVAVVPGAPALLSCYASIVDPIPQVRAAVSAVVAWLAEDAGSVRVLGDARFADQLLPGLAQVSDADRVLVVASGSAKRTEKAPGYFDPRAVDFDRAVEAAIAGGDVATLARIDHALAAELWARGLKGFGELADLSVVEAELRYAGDPYGVQYWVASWVASRSG